jgi:hypothetical protein
MFAMYRNAIFKGNYDDSQDESDNNNVDHGNENDTDSASIHCVYQPWLHASVLIQQNFKSLIPSLILPMQPTCQ